MMNSSSNKHKEALVNEPWKPLHFACSVGDLDSVKSMLREGEDANITPNSLAVPNLTPMHIACGSGNVDLIRLLIPHCDMNKQDQWGFTPLHYATVSRKKEAINMLLSAGASASIAAKSGLTARDLAEELHFDDIVDALTSKINIQNDPTVPKFKEWLNHIGGGEYLRGFLDAGYDLPFVAKNGLNDDDLDCVDVPKSKMGLRKKLIALHALDKFYTKEADSDEDEGSEEEGSDAESSDDDT